MTIIMTFGATVMVESSLSLPWIPPVYLCFISIINKVNPSSCSLLAPVNYIQFFLAPAIQKSMSVILTLRASVKVASSQSLSRIPLACLFLLVLFMKLILLLVPYLSYSTILDVFLAPTIQNSETVIMTLGALIMVASSQSLSHIPLVSLCFIDSSNKEHPSYLHLCRIEPYLTIVSSSNSEKHGGNDTLEASHLFSLRWKKWLSLRWRNIFLK
jgi:hypothetical protein